MATKAPSQQLIEVLFYFSVQEMRETREQDAEEVVVIKDSKMDDSRDIDRHPTHALDVETFPHQRETIKRHRGPSHHRPLARTQSSPLVTFSMPPQQTQETGPVRYTYTTGIYILLYTLYTLFNNWFG